MDFGIKDAFAGPMKGVILTIRPDATIVDLSHGDLAILLRGGLFIIQ